MLMGYGTALTDHGIELLACNCYQVRLCALQYKLRMLFDFRSKIMRQLGQRAMGVL
jgi:hypothetical protein